MMRCCVAFCKNTTDNVTEPEHVTFHEFPTELHQRDAWLRALGKHDTVLPEPAVVCSQHFLCDDMYETDSGRQICNGAIPCTVKVCIICFDTDSRMLLINKYNLEKSYENLTGHSLCVGGNLKPMLCVECAQRLINFSRFRDKSLRARSLMLDLVTNHELISRRQIKSVNREKHQLKSNIVKTTLKPDHCNVFIQEHIGGEMKLDEAVTAENEEMCTGMFVDEPNFVVVNEKTEHEDGDHGYSAVRNREDISDESIMLAIRLVDEAAMTARLQMKEAQARVLLKYENNSCKCTVCFREFLNEEAYNEHMMIHVKSEGECVSDACQSQCEHPPALRTDTRAPHTHSSSPGSSLRTAHSRPSQTPPEGSAVNSLHTRLEKHDLNKCYTCNICQKTIKRHCDVIKHMRIHLGVKPFACTLCEYKCSWSGSLTKHMRRHPGEKPFSCSICDYKCIKRDDLTTHMITHTGEKPFACALCDYKCNWNGSLTKHMRIHTGEKPFTCSLCDFKCSWSGSLITHMRTHTGEKPFTCNVCEKKFIVSSQLQIHMRTHTGDKPFSCRLCDYKCSTSSSLTNHMRTHTGEKPFACTLCDYKCKSSSCLQKHMRIHTGNKPYSCTICNYKCSASGHLTMHIRTHTGFKPFSCKLCDHKYSRRSYLTKHLKTHSGEQPVK